MLYHCEGGDVSDVVHKDDCVKKGHPYKWVNCKYNFDDLGQVKNCLDPKATAYCSEVRLLMRS